MWIGINNISYTPYEPACPQILPNDSFSQFSCKWGKWMTRYVYILDQNSDLEQYSNWLQRNLVSLLVNFNPILNSNLT